MADDEIGDAHHAARGHRLAGNGMRLDREAEPFQHRPRACRMRGAIARRVFGRDLDQLGQEGLPRGESRRR